MALMALAVGNDSMRGPVLAVASPCFWSGDSGRVAIRRQSSPQSIARATGPLLTAAVFASMDRWLRAVARVDAIAVGSSPTGNPRLLNPGEWNSRSCHVLRSMCL